MNIITSGIRAIALSVALGGSLAQGAQAVTIYLGTTADFAPYNYLNNDGEVRGFEADLAKLVCTRADIDCTWVPTPEDELVSSLNAGDIDAIMSDFQITPARKLRISFSDAYLPAGPDAILVRSDGIAPATGAIVGAQSGTLDAEYVSKQGWSLSQYTTPADGLQALISGEISAYVGDQAHLQSIVTANPGDYRLALGNIPVDGDIAIGVRQGDQGLLSAFNSAIASLKADGTLDALIGKWFDGRDPNYRGAEKTAKSEQSTSGGG